MQNSILIVLFISACFGIVMVSSRRYGIDDYDGSGSGNEGDYGSGDYGSGDYGGYGSGFNGEDEDGSYGYGSGYGSGNGYGGYGKAGGGRGWSSLSRGGAGGDSPRVSYRSCKGPFQKCYRHDECCLQYCKGKLSKAKKCTG